MSYMSSSYRTRFDKRKRIVQDDTGYTTSERASTTPSASIVDDVVLMEQRLNTLKNDYIAQIGVLDNLLTVSPVNIPYDSAYAFQLQGNTTGNNNVTMIPVGTASDIAMYLSTKGNGTMYLRSPTINLQSTGGGRWISVQPSVGGTQVITTAGATDVPLTISTAGNGNITLSPGTGGIVSVNAPLTSTGPVSGTAYIAILTTGTSQTTLGNPASNNNTPVETVIPFTESLVNTFGSRLTITTTAGPPTTTVFTNNSGGVMYLDVRVNLREKSGTNSKWHAFVRQSVSTFYPMAASSNGAEAWQKTMLSMSGILKLTAGETFTVYGGNNTTATNIIIGDSGGVETNKSTISIKEILN